MAARPARPPGARVDRLRHRDADGARHRPRSCAHHVLAERGWDVGRDGLAGAPRIRVLAGEKSHITLDRALRLLGLGAPEVVDADEQGRMRADALADALAGDAPTIVCAQAGEVNTGAFDPLDAIADRTAGRRALGCTSTARSGSGRRSRRSCGTSSRAGARRLVDDRRAQVAQRPLRLRDRLLRAPGIAPGRDERAATYLIQDDGGGLRDQLDWVPEFSRRARGFAVYAALRSLGRSGVVELVERCCAQARRFAEGSRRCRAPRSSTTSSSTRCSSASRRRAHGRGAGAVQRAGGSGSAGRVGGRRAIRVSVSNWQTGDEETTSPCRRSPKPRPCRPTSAPAPAR